MIRVRSVPLIRLNRNLVLLIITFFLLYPFLISVYRQYSNLYENVHAIPLTETQYERYCRQVDQRIRNEQISTIPIRLDPTKPIPYYYSRWRSTPLLPRDLTPCEHAIYMDLLSILIENVFKKYNIPYMLIAGALLGSHNHHDLLPWDDDVDISVPIKHRFYLQEIILGELAVESHSVVLMQRHNDVDYDKVYFSWCPHPVIGKWRFPFIDIFYHGENSTHIWLIGKPSECPVRREEIFPLVLRPLGPLWVYGPREPVTYFESRNIKGFERDCYAPAYSHKVEQTIRKEPLVANCSQLRSFYPYVERRCTNNCIEELKSDDNTIIQTFVSNHAFRTFWHYDTNKSFRAC